MSKPINDPAWWDKRLTQASNSGDLRRAVYETTDEDWQVIDANHKEILKKYIPEDLDVYVLDAACGYGRASEWFSNNLYRGIDSCASMVHKAIALYGIPDQSVKKDFYTCDLKDLPLNDNHFDWSFCISLQAMVIRELGFNDWQEIQQELLRVTKEGIIVLEYGNKQGGSKVYSVIRSL